MKTNWIEILFNLLFWLVTVWFISYSFSIQAQELELVDGQEFTKVIRNETIFWKLLWSLFLSFVAFYINLWNIGSHYPSAHKIRVISIAVGVFLAVGVLYLIFQKMLFGPDSIPLPEPILIGILAFYLTTSTAYGIIKVLLRSEKQQQQLLLDKKQAELNLLRNQLQPHFLFNALNNLLAMVDQQKSPQLARAFDKLSQLLRYVIEETKGQRVVITKEVEFIRNYADLQLLRFDAHEVDFNFTIEGTYQDQEIEPGLLISFVENAFKYGTEPEKQSKIEACLLMAEPNKIVFTIKNTILDFAQKTDNTGTGLQATRERLELVYPNKHSLKINKTNEFLVELTITTR